MADPKYYVGSAVNRAVIGKVLGKPSDLTSGTITVWNPSDTEVVTDAAMTIAGPRATYQIATTAILVAGTFKVEIVLVFANSQGTLLYQETFAVLAVYP